MIRVSVLVSGGGTNLQAILDAIERGALQGVAIGGVISNNAHAYALERARIHGIETAVVSPKAFPDREAFTDAMLEQLAAFRTELIVLAGYLVVVPPRLVVAYPGRILNIHPSLIPAFCGKGCYGLKVHEMALARGVKVTGATVHLVDEGTDTGPILLQKAVEVLEGDTPEALQLRVMQEAEWVLLPRAIAMVAGELAEKKAQKNQE